MPAQLGNILLDTQILNKAEVSGVIVDTLNTVENIVAEAVSTAWKAGGSKTASAFNDGDLLIEANEGKVYNLSDALTITDQNKQYFTENAEGTYPAGTNIAVIETTPAVYAAASGTAVSGTKYYAKNGNYYTEVPVQAGDSVEGLYTRTSQPVYKYDVLAGTDAANVKQINMGDDSAGNQLTPVDGVITIPFASGSDDGSTPTNGLIRSGDMDHLNSIESGANIGFSTVVTTESSSVTAGRNDTSLLVSGINGLYTRSGTKSAHNNTPTLIIEAFNATSSSPGVTKLYTSVDNSVDGAVTPKAVSGAISGAITGLRNYSSVTWKKAEPGSTSAFTSGTANPTSRADSLTVKTDSPVMISGTEGSVTLGVRTATDTYTGVTKLYTDATGTNNDGAVTQGGVKTAVESRVKKSIALSGLRQVSNDTQTPIPASINSSGMPNTLYGLIKALKFAANHAS